MNTDQLFEDWYLIKSAAESGDDHHYIRGLYPALERFEEVLSLIVYSDYMVNEHLYHSCSEGESFLECTDSCSNFENKNLNFPTVHPPVSSKELKQAIEYAKILSAKWKRSLKK